MKKIISIILSAAAAFTLCVPAYATPKTTDTLKAWKYESRFRTTDTIGALAKDGITFSSESGISFYDSYITLPSYQDVIYNPTPMLSGDYTFETQFKVTNTNDHWITFNRNGDSYYKLQLFKHSGNAAPDSDYAKKVMRLSKISGDTITTLAEVNYTSDSTGWWTNNILSFSISQKRVENGLDITVCAHSSRSKETVTLSCTDTEDFYERGSAGIHFYYCGVPTVYYINAYSSPCEKERDFYRTYADISDWKGYTEEELNNLGLTFPKLKFASTRNQFVDFVNQGNGIIKYTLPGTDVIPGSYEIDCTYSWLYNKHSMRFNVNGSSYYTVVQDTETVNGKTAYVVKLNRVSGDTTETIASQSFDTSQFIDTYASSTYKLRVNRENESLNIKLDVSNAAYALALANDKYGSFSLEATDTNPLADGAFQIMCNYTGSPKLVRFRCAVKEKFGGSIGTSPGTYTKAIAFDKEFTSADSVDSLLKEGINTAYNKPANSLVFTDSGVNYGGLSGAAQVLYTPGNLKSDSYSFSTTHSTNNQRASWIRFNVSEDKNTYYLFKFVISNDYSNPSDSLELYKTVNGAEPVLLASTPSADRGAAGAYSSTKLTVDMKKTDDGNNITLTAKGLRYGGTDTLSFTDTSEPLPSGDFILGFGEYGGNELLKNLSYSTDKLITLNDECLFYINGAYSTSYKKGKISIEAPVRILGNYTVTAVLYEDYEMTGLIMLTPEELANGKVQLFDTTDSEAKDGSVKVFFFDEENTLNNCAGIYELN